MTEREQERAAVVDLLMERCYSYIDRQRDIPWWRAWLPSGEMTALAIKWRLCASLADAIERGEHVGKE